MKIDSGRSGGILSLRRGLGRSPIINASQILTETRQGRVSVCSPARSEGGGCRGIPISGLERVLPEFMLIINTVPARILDGELLGKIRKDALILDLASKPGGDGSGDGKITG